jgi:hypothetical protein
MGDTDLQIIKQQVSDLKLRVLKQQTLTNGIRRAGGAELEAAHMLLGSMREDLAELEKRLDRLLSVL